MARSTSNSSSPTTMFTAAGGGAGTGALGEAVPGVGMSAACHIADTAASWTSRPSLAGRCPFLIARRKRQRRPDGLVPGVEGGPAPPAAQGFDHVKPATRLRREVWFQERRRAGVGVGDHANKVAGLAQQ